MDESGVAGITMEGTLPHGKQNGQQKTGSTRHRVENKIALALRSQPTHTLSGTGCDEFNAVLRQFPVAASDVDAGHRLRHFPVGSLTRPIGFSDRTDVLDSFWSGCSWNPLPNRRARTARFHKSCPLHSGGRCALIFHSHFGGVRTKRRSPEFQDAGPVLPAQGNHN